MIVFNTTMYTMILELPAVTIGNRYAKDFPETVLCTNFCSSKAVIMWTLEFWGKWLLDGVIFYMKVI